MRPSFAYFRSSLHAPLLGCALLVAGCASLPPPTSELAAAQQALARAEAADADQYAADALAEARAGLQAAQAALARGRSDQARAGALAASTAADQAWVRSGVARSRADLSQQRAEVARLRAQLQVDAGPAPADPLEFPVADAPPEQRLQALDADIRLNSFAQYERLQARQAVAALATAARRDLPLVLAQATRRVEIAEQAARVEATRREIERLERERNDLLVEASRREADRARAEAERMRLQAQLQAEEAERLRAQAQQAEAALDGAQVEQQGKVDAAREKEAALARKEAELTAGGKLPAMHRDARGSVFTLPAEAFAGGKAQLTASAGASVKALAIYLAAIPGGAVQVLAYTDNRGKAAANQALTDKRAQLVRASLVAAGLPRSRVSAQGKGSSSPVADNGSAAGRAKNRRVDIVVSDNP